MDFNSLLELCKKGNVSRNLDNLKSWIDSYREAKLLEIEILRSSRTVLEGNKMSLKLYEANKKILEGKRDMALCSMESAEFWILNSERIQKEEQVAAEEQQKKLKCKKVERGESKNIII